MGLIIFRIYVINVYLPFQVNSQLPYNGIAVNDTRSSGLAHELKLTSLLKFLSIDLFLSTSPFIDYLVNLIVGLLL